MSRQPGDGFGSRSNRAKESAKFQTDSSTNRTGRRDIYSPEALISTPPVVISSGEQCNSCGQMVSITGECRCSL